MTYSLRSLLLAFVVIASALGTFGPCGLAVGLLIVAGVAFFRSVWPSGLKWLFLAAVIAFLYTLLLPTVQTSREAARRRQCTNNLKLIALGLLNYEQQYGTFPPAYVPGPDGKPWHSWRVLILPFIEQEALYAAYHFDEPWDGPNNSKLASAVPSIYVCPSSNERSTRSRATTYFAVVGPKTAWPGAKGRAIDDIADGTSNTIVVMEAHGLGVSWMDPRDLDFDQVTCQAAPDPKIIGDMAHPYRPGFFYVEEGGMIALAFSDGSVRAVPWGVPGEALAPFLTAQDGDNADHNLLRLAYSPRLNWPRIFSLAVLVLSTLLLWRSTRPVRSAFPGPEQQSTGTGDTIGPSPDDAPHDIPP